MSAAAACTSPPTTGASTRSISSSAACSAPIAGTGFADWPITYADLEPYYTKVEWEVGVSGLAGASPFDPPRTKPYPMPPLPVKSSGVLFERGARKLGWHPFPAPMAILSQPYRGRRSACVNCGFCHGFGCEVGAKCIVAGDASFLRRRRTGRCEIRPDCYVLPHRDRIARAAPPASPISTSNKQRALAESARPWSCAPTAPKRRACC